MKRKQSLYAVLATSVRITVPEAECQCALNGEQYDFCYRLPPKAEVKGRRFDCEHINNLERLDLLSNKNALDFELQALPEPPFVTAMSDNHFKEGRTLVGIFMMYAFD
ncbi:hypothetical protein ANCDUO_09606 [Ancylostoma duodenale]|uniref:Uncharacterized protein n=1 Tax=Ancylostoma duodenale TaxID=51022 RepID=A0A0C2GMC6_9BILA|nr:hypothetical protein ANCDUO_09606 [Ancylostoma duodenale]